MISDLRFEIYEFLFLRTLRSLWLVTPKTGLGATLFSTCVHSCLPRVIACPLGGKAVISQDKFVVMEIKNPARDCGAHCGSVPLFGHG
jgi:hypothetical protein